MKWQEWHQFKSGVYFVQCNATGYVKIGFSSYIGGRVRDLNQFSVRGVRLLFAVPGTMADEAFLHARCAEWRKHMEWFAPTPGLFKVIADLRLRFGPDSMRTKTWKGFAGLRQEQDADPVGAALTLIECGLDMLAANPSQSAELRGDFSRLLERMQTMDIGSGSEEGLQ